MNAKTLTRPQSVNFSKPIRELCESMYSICKFCISQRQAITRCGQCNYIRGLIQPHHCLEEYILSTRQTHIATLIGNTCRAFTESFDGTITETHDLANGRTQ